jgi:hypothetical protein
MSESKLADVEVPSLDVKRITVEPNVCELTAPLGLDVEFTLDRPVAGGVWEIKVCDSCVFVVSHRFSSFLWLFVGLWRNCDMIWHVL